MSVDHYENFPVASFLLPKHLRPAVQTIYAFARSADDIADEGHAPTSIRLELLTEYEDGLDRIEHNLTAKSELFQSLEDVIRDYRLPLLPFRDLLSAFKQDVVKTRYASFQEVLDYCRRSANPVGELMLYLYDAVDVKNLNESDAICSALQLINFWQDVAIDWQKDRVYLPQNEMRAFGVSENHLAQQIADDAWRSLMRFQVDRARTIMRAGAPLASRLPGRIGWELRMVVQGGLRILEKIESADYDVFRQRPKLGKLDWLRMAWNALDG
ncbi:MAG: putative phytoene synthase CrtB-like [Burkholderiaceae bacterium]|nr:putative phytoene synthase CrtB-like [Burkholderiaceae bacterium]